MLVADRTVTRNQLKNGFKASWARLYLHHFLPMFCHIWWFFKVIRSTFSMLHFENSSNMAKLWQNRVSGTQFITNIFTLQRCHIWVGQTGLQLFWDNKCVPHWSFLGPSISCKIGLFQRTYCSGKKWGG